MYFVADHDTPRIILRDTNRTHDARECCVEKLQNKTDPLSRFRRAFRAQNLKYLLERTYCTVHQYAGTVRTVRDVISG